MHTENPYEVPSKIQNRPKDGIFTHSFIRYIQPAEAVAVAMQHVGP
jgi:hypothetical protein